ncbi:hypothetical protein [Brevibacillus nitrificans]|uniref:hypothetical protein n=1 Tax=Brevibacillus nitrificans TaxID=651560 RepID=UPI00286717B6|nr:hypothetical protein [Brevibacillus nitrificans]MDR7317536.1 hypothetical protein [Brevibacillus nitrificans]
MTTPFLYSRSRGVHSSLEQPNKKHEKKIHAGKNSSQRHIGKEATNSKKVTLMEVGKKCQGHQGENP